MLPISVAPTVSDLRNIVASWRKEQNRIALVPTMGALHEGHLSLVHLARNRAERVVVSIFVNPTQFAPNEDFSKYPRTFEDDCAKLAGLADLVFAPAIAEMYPPGAATTIVPAGPAAVGLEDRFRPTHFQGVTTVVAKLLIQATPDRRIRGKRLSAAQGRDADNHGPVPARRDRPCPNGSRARWSRHVLPQPLPVF